VIAFLFGFTLGVIAGVAGVIFAVAQTVRGAW